MKQLFIVIISIFVIMAVTLNGAQNSKGLSSKVTLTEEFSIDTEKFDEGITIISNIDLDKDGNLYLLDLKLKKIVVLGFKGEFIREFGKKGQGPGELRIPTNINVNTRGEIVVTDVGNRKFSIFQKDGKLIKEIRFNVRAVEGIILDNGNFLFKTNIFPDSRSEGIKLALHLYNPKFEKIKELNEIETINIFASKIIGLYNNLSLGISRDKIIVGNPVNGYDILVFDFNGKLLKKIAEKYDPVPTSEEYKNVYSEQIGKSNSMIKNKLVFPEVLPPFHNLLTDEEGRIFVFTYEKDKNSSAYMVDVFSREGKLFSRIPFKFPPFARHIKRIRNNRLYYIYEQENGSQKIIRYKLSWKDKKN